MTFTLRPYQQKVVSEVYSAWALGFRNVLAVLPTGAGKTRTFSHIIREFDGPAVAIAHRHELVAQISLALGQAGVRHGIVAADATIRGIVRLHMDEFGRSFYEPSARVKVASVDTLIRVNPSEPWLSRVGLWVQDEAHHLLRANKWGAATKMLVNAQGLGVTATPCRADGLGLGLQVHVQILQGFGFAAQFGQHQATVTPLKPGLGQKHHQPVLHRQQAGPVFL